MTSGRARPFKTDALAGAGFALVLILVMAVSGFGVRGLWLADQAGAEIEVGVARTLALQQVAAGFATMHQQVLVLAHGPSLGNQDLTMAALAKLRTQAQAMRDAAAEPAGRAVAERLILGLDGYGAELRRLALGNGAAGGALASLEAKAQPVAELVQAEVQGTAQALAVIRQKQQADTNDSVVLIVGGAGFALVIGLVSAWLIRRHARRVTAETAVMTDHLSRVFVGIAEGDLTQHVGADPLGRFQKMADDVNDTVEKLAGMVAQIHEAAATIAHAAGEVAVGGNDLADRTERQAASLEQTAAALDQLASTFKSYCEHAHEANDMVSEARKAGEHGVTVVASAIDAMQRIVDSSEKIKGIIRVTEEISRRINMLALNAAVEAARAGEAGKGFGVVAREVGSLAGRSAQASQQIKDLIFNSDHQIQHGVRMVTQSGEALQTIVKSVDHAAALFNDIAISAAGQSGMLHEINAAVGQMDETTQMNAALAEQTCAASQALRQESAKLNELVSFFLLEPGQADPGMGRHIVLIESTKLDHLSFMKRIHEAIAGHRTTAAADVSNHHQCRLGKWYDTIELPVVRLNAAYRALERPHALVHDAARQALHCHAASDKAGCDQALAEMAQASHQVLALIDDLAADLRDHASDPHARTVSAPAGGGALRQLQSITESGARRCPDPPLGNGRGGATKPRGALRHATDPQDHDWAEF